MSEEPDNPDHHRRRSQFIRQLVQELPCGHSVDDRYKRTVPRTIVQFWHNLRELPSDIMECVASWAHWKTSGYTHRLFDEATARGFIGESLGSRYEAAFDLCYHPAMQADYFRLCYLFVEGGFYVDADDACIGGDISWLFEDSRLKLQPLCYDVAAGKMVAPSLFLSAGAGEPGWIFYFNNNPLIAGKGHPIIEHALIQATTSLERAIDVLPEIQATTGPGNLSRSIFKLGTSSGAVVERDLLVLRDWDSTAVSRWPLSHRLDARNWRLSNQKRFDLSNG